MIIICCNLQSIFVIFFIRIDVTHLMEELMSSILMKTHKKDILRAASNRGNEVMIRLLLNESANVNAEGKYYGNALQAAVDKSHEVMIQLLLENDVDVNAERGYYENALQAAAYNDHEVVFQLL